MRPESWVGSAARVVFGSPGAAVPRLTEADRLLRSALPLSRRVSFVAVGGGSGTTSVAVSVASVLAGRRAGMVLGVDAARGASGLRRQTQQEARTDEPEKVEPERARRRAARDAAEARCGLDRTASGLHLLDLPGRRPGPAPVSEWAEEVGPVARFFDLVITDWGVRPAAVDLGEVAATSHVLVVVSRADRSPATAAAAAVAAVRGAGGAPPLTLLALVDVGRTPDRMAAGLRRELGSGVHLVPTEPERSRRAAPSSRRFGASTRWAHLRLAAAVMQAAVDSQTPAGRAVAAPVRHRPRVTDRSRRQVPA